MSKARIIHELHDDLGVTLSEAEKAYDIAVEYIRLRSTIGDHPEDYEPSEYILVKASSQKEQQKWHDCDPTDKSTLPEPGSWAIWCDKEGHKIIARWKEDAIDHFWPDQRMFDFYLEDAVAWTEIPKRMEIRQDDQ